MQQQAEAPLRLLDDRRRLPRGDNITSEPTKRGTAADYLTVRIARDLTDILERMKAGESKSVRKAALEAGIVIDGIKVWN